MPDDFKPVTISEQFIRHPAIGVGNAGVYTCRGSNIQASAKKDIYIEGMSSAVLMKHQFTHAFCVAIAPPRAEVTAE